MEDGMENRITSYVEEIENFKKSNNFSKAAMKGFYEDLIRIKQDVEKLFNNRVYFLGYPLDDAPFHGWDEESLKNMHDIDNAVRNKVLELYAILLQGLGE